jgi:MFS family permease
MFPLAYYMHRFIEDTPEFRQAETALAETTNRPRSSVLQVLRRPKQMLLAAMTFLTASISFYVIVTGVIDFGVRELGFGRNTMLTAVMLGMIPFAIATVGFAWLSDIVGRRSVYAGGVVLAGVWAFALFPLMETGNFGLVLLAVGVGQVGVGAMFGPAMSLFAEMFPPSVRYSGASLGNQIANIVGGGLAPFIMVALLAATGTTLSVSACVGVAAVLSLIALSLIRLPAADAT